MQFIHLLLLLGASGLTTATRLVAHSLSSQEVRQILRAADRLDAIPAGHEVVGGGVAVLDEDAQKSASGQGARLFGLHSAIGYKEICFGSAPRQQRMQLARSPTTPSRAATGNSPSVTSPVIPISTAAPPTTPASTPPPVPASPPTASAPAPPSSPAVSPTIASPTSPAATPTPTTTISPTASPTASPTTSPSFSPGTPTAPTTPISPTTVTPIPTPAPTAPVQCITLKKK